MARAPHPAQLAYLSFRPSEMDANPSGREPADEYMVDRIIDYRLNHNGTTSYRIRWYSFGPSGDKWEPLVQIPYHLVARPVTAKRPSSAVIAPQEGSKP